MEQADASTSSENTNVMTPNSPSSSVELYVVVVLLLIFCVLGVAGNAIVLAVFSGRGDQQVSTVFIVVLAAVDFTTCLAVVPFTVYMELVHFNVGVDFVCKLYQFLITCNIPFSAMIMAAIAVDRYLSICKPLVSALTALRAWLVTAVLGLFAAAIGVCVALMYSVRHYVPLDDDDDDRKQFSANQTSPADTVFTTDAGSRRCFQSATSGDEIVDCPTTPSQSVMIEVDRGVCYPTDKVFSIDFIWYFQKVYNGLYLVCFVTVVVLYVLIYRSVLVRRSRHQRRKNRSVSLIVTQSQRHQSSARPPSRSVISVRSDAGNLHEMAATPGTAASTEADDVMVRAVLERRRNRVANLKTAAMLFVVTVVFVVTFLPAFLMTIELLPYSMTVFYMYFANNVANPIIYSFMNHNFREHLKRMMCRQRRHVGN